MGEKVGNQWQWSHGQGYGGGGTSDLGRPGVVLIEAIAGR